MAYVEIGGQRQAIPVGEMIVGSDPAAHVVLPGENVAARHAIVVGLPDGQVSIRLVDESVDVLVNGVRMGAQPVALLHGDKIEIAGHELLFVDERRSGSTQYVEAVDPSMLAAAKPFGQRAPTSGTGGRLVSLTDGREYSVSGQSLLIGRDAGCEVVITSKNISRRHAEVIATPKGYLLVDSSTNGTFVNGERVAGQKLLARSDVIRCGDHEFRFYADVAPEPESQPAAAPQAAASPPAATPEPATAPPPVAAPEPAAAPPPAATPEPAASPPPAQPGASVTPSTPPPGAEHRLSHTLHGVPAMQRPAGSPKGRPAPPYRPPERSTAPTPEQRGTPAPSAEAPAESTVMANVVVRSGPLRGKRFPIKVPIVNVGRADYNDIVLVDESVSTTHAKLQRREGIWILVDLDSTNGTMVDGERVEGEVPLAPGALVRFGQVQTIFEPTDDTIDPRKGSSTRLIDAIRLPDPPSSGSRGTS